MVDQMRWDYLYRYYDRYAANGGFKRFLQQGFSCENTYIPYTPTVTACGHTCIYTGSVPAIHGIVGNNWWDNRLMRNIYCAEDKTVTTVGGNPSEAGQMSPRNLQVTTIGDELKLATNFRSKVIGIAIKDRGGILPAGHAANGAYWYDSKSGDFITSTYYTKELPQWVKDFNAKKMVDKYYAQNWNTLYPVNTYAQSTSDEKAYEGKPFGAEQKGFPYSLKKFIAHNYGAIAATPYGNSLTAELAKAAITGEELGADSITDVLTVSFSSPDYIGHTFGPNSIEQEDDFLQLDGVLGDLFRFLDARVGKGQYLVFLSADHGAAQVPGFMAENRLPGGVINEAKLRDGLVKNVKEKFGSDRIISGLFNYEIYLNHQAIDSLHVDEEVLRKWIIEYVSGQEGVAKVFSLDRVSATTLNEKQKKMFANSYYPARSGDIQIVFQPNWIEGGATGTSHGLWNPYDSHIPLLWYGWNIQPGKSHRENYMTDISPTLAALLHIQEPSGSVGKVIEEVAK